MKAISSLLASLLFTSACGSVTADPTHSGDDGPGSDAGLDSDGDAGSNPDSPPQEQLPFLVDAPTVSTVPTPLSSVSYGPTLIQLVRPTSASAQFSVLEQRIVPTTSGPITVKVQLERPTVAFTRSIATFFEAPVEAWFPVQFLCSENNVPTNDPRCSTEAPVASLDNASGEVADARWRVYIIDANGVTVDGCVDTDLSIDCVLPNPVGATYKIIVAADGFAQLWRSNLALQQLSTLVGPMTGAHVPDRVVCKHFAAEGGSSRVWCDSYDTYIGYAGMDSASLTIEPIQLSISSGVATETFMGPAIQWSPGNNDLPGDPY